MGRHQSWDAKESRELWDQIVLAWAQCERPKVCTYNFGKSVKVAETGGKARKTDNRVTHSRLPGLVPAINSDNSQPPFSGVPYPIISSLCLWKSPSLPTFKIQA